MNSVRTNAPPFASEAKKPAGPESVTARAVRNDKEDG